MGKNISTGTITASLLSARAWEIYRDCPMGMRLIQTYRPYICPFERLIPWIPASGRVLDIGCGSGLLLLLAGSLNHRIQGLGLDAAGGPIALAQKAGSALASRGMEAALQFHRVDKDAPWPDEEFDLVSMVDVLHHVPRAAQEGFIGQAVARVRRGGIFLYKDMCRRPLWRAAGNTLHDLVMVREWAKYRNIQDVESWCAHSGLDLTHSEDAARFWYGHELRVMVKR